MNLQERSGNASLQEGIKLARGIFALRGNHSEIHLSEVELAAQLALAYRHGVQACINALRPLKEYPDDNGGKQAEIGGEL